VTIPGLVQAVSCGAIANAPDRTALLACNARNVVTDWCADTFPHATGPEHCPVDVDDAAYNALRANFAEASVERNAELTPFTEFEEMGLLVLV